jgi:hypothetical protein
VRRVKEVIALDARDPCLSPTRRGLAITRVSGPFRWSGRTDSIDFRRWNCRGLEVRLYPV